MKTESMKSKLREMLSTKRYEHSLGVCAEAVKIAEYCGEDAENAYIAGLLHDCAKGFSEDEQIRLCGEYGIALDKITLACPPIIHAPLGAETAKREFGIDDEEILAAIRFHTVARAEMTTLEKIIYVADMTEPMRDFDGVDKIRALAYENLDEAFLEALNQSIGFNLKKNTVIHPDTLNARNDMLIRKGRKANGY